MRLANTTPAARRDKSYRVKADVQDAEQGTVHAIVSCFGNKDSYGDIVCRGAFSRFITDAKAASDLPPGVWAHDWDRPVAKTIDMWEEEDGLHVIGQFNLETQDGRDAYSNVKQGLFTEYSFAFQVTDRQPTKDGNLLKEIYPVYEWSPLIVGANRATRTVDVKAGDTSPAAPVHFKADYLSPYAEANACIAALQSLASDLFWGPVFDCCFATGDMDGMTADERLSLLESAYAEYADLSMRAARSLMQMAQDAEAAEGADEAPDEDDNLYMGAYKAFLETHFPKDDTASEAPAAKLAEQSDAVRDAVKRLHSRVVAVNSYRQKEGRVLSEASRNRVSGVRDDLAACVEQLDTFLTDTAPQPAKADEKAALSVKADILRTLHRLRTGKLLA